MRRDLRWGSVRCGCRGRRGSGIGDCAVRREDVIASRVARTRHAYVVFDRRHRTNLDLVKAYAERIGIRLLGRFGQFEDINTDQCLLRAAALAEELGGAG